MTRAEARVSLIVAVQALFVSRRLTKWIIALCQNRQQPRSATLWPRSGHLFVTYVLF